MADRFKRLPGRRFLNTETGKVISRRQHDKIVLGIRSFESKAAKNKQENLKESLARPARGRKKARVEAEKESRVQSFLKTAEEKRLANLEKRAAQVNAHIKLKKIRPQLLKTGHFSVRMAFKNYDQYVAIIKDARKQYAPKVGGKLITSYSLGLTGFDSRDKNISPRVLTPAVIQITALNTIYSEEEFDEEMEAFLEEKANYFIFTGYWIHLKFNEDYGKYRIKQAQHKKLKSLGIK